MNSLRRDHLDKLLNSNISIFEGKVLDVGGKKTNRKGFFVPPKKNVISWKYLNTDKSTMPDICSSVEQIPLENSSVDVVVMTELIEYLPNPLVALKEIERILNVKGVAIISSPLIHPIHGDYWEDRHRFTKVKLEEYINNSGLKVISIEPMGSIGSVIFDILRASVGYAGNNKKKRIRNLLLRALKPFFKFIDILSKDQKKYINTGYFIVAEKEKINE